MSPKAIQAILRYVIPSLWLAAIVVAALAFETRGRLLVHTGGNTMTKLELVLFDLGLVILSTILVWTFTGVGRGASSILSAGLGAAVGTIVTVTSVLILWMHSTLDILGPMSSQMLGSISGEIFAAGAVGFFLGAILEGLRQQFSPSPTSVLHVGRP